jgi:hypothetical protein
MAIEDAVELLAMYVEDRGETMESRFGSEAVAAARDMAALISTRLDAESVHVGLWNEFERAPDENIEELIGALEAHIEGDPSLARLLNAYMSEIHGEMASQESEEPPAERRIAVMSGDALDDAVSLDADEVEQDRRSYQPGMMGSDVDYDDSVDRGTYIYGEIAAGRDTVGQEAGMETVDYVDFDARPTELAALSGVVGLFEELRMAVDDYPNLEDEQKRAVWMELTALEEALQGPEAEDGERLVSRLEKLQQYSPDIAEIVIEAMTVIDLPPSTKEAVEKLSPQPPEEG